jgi:SAM-dependent methyltransferase
MEPRTALHRYNSHADYVRIQTRGNADKADRVWAKETNIRYYADYLRRRHPAPRRGLCHGTRGGQEQQWFSDALGCDVIGTEIGATALTAPRTIQWDFHEIKPEWEGAFDFIYTNSFDHAYDPQRALMNWMRCVKPGRVCLIEHSDRHGPAGASELDPFGIELPELLLAITRWGAGDFYVREILEKLPYTRPAPKFLCCVVVEKN